MRDERDEMIESGFTPVSLVGGTLRFETAGIAGLAVVRAMLGSGTDANEEGEQ